MNKKFKRLNIFLASAACCASLGFGLASAGVFTASAATYAPSSIFTRSGGVTVAALGEGDDAKRLAFTFKDDEDKVSYNRDLAWKWYEADETNASKGVAKFLNMAFSLEDNNFAEFTVTLETASLTATEKNKVTNKIVFTVSPSGVIYAKLDGEGNEEKLVCEAGAKKIALSVEEAIPAAGERSGEYKVFVNDTELGTIENVGSDYAGYVSGDDGRVPLSFSAKLAEEKESTVCVFEELNGQSFELNDSKEVEDTAAPVLVIDDDSYVSAMGQTFALETKTIDVLDRSSSVKSTAEYFQWTPVSTEAKYKSLDSVKILEMQYEKDGKTTSVYDETFEGRTAREYISVKYTLADSTHKKDAGENEAKAAEVYAAWYLKNEKYEMELADDAHTKLQLLAVCDDEEAPVYEGGLLSETDSFATKYAESVKEKAADLEAGSGESFYLPSPENLFRDNSTGYKSLKYTLCYKLPKSTSASNTSNVSLSSLKLTVEQHGVYEFKLFVTDRAGNAMKSTKTGETEAEEITTDNIWEHDELPTFSFTVTKQKKIYIDDGSKSSRSDTGLIGVKYSDISFTVKGGTASKTEYGLYYFDLAYFNELYGTQYRLAASDLTSLTSTDLSGAKTVEEAAERYAATLAGKLDATGSELTSKDFITAKNGKAVLRKIEEYRDKVSEENAPSNKYEWDADAKSFLPVESGNYIVFGVFKDETPGGGYAVGYKSVAVTDKEDINPGESDWLKNNLVSVILFSIAGVMLILIIILLFVKPSDETLEDVGAEKAAKVSKSSKTAKKEKK